MAQKKEDLQKLLELIDKWANEEGNDWFRNELIKRYSQTNYLSSASDPRIVNIGQNVEIIQRYLMLDIIPVIDYSDIAESNVRNQLFRDCIEMGKYRLGKINHKVDFDEFCRYAH